MFWSVNSRRFSEVPSRNSKHHINIHLHVQFVTIINWRLYETITRPGWPNVMVSMYHLTSIKRWKWRVFALILRISSTCTTSNVNDRSEQHSDKVASSEFCMCSFFALCHIPANHPSHRLNWEWFCLRVTHTGIAAQGYELVVWNAVCELPLVLLLKCNHHIINDFLPITINSLKLKRKGE
jgi:hypothetical protein